MAYLMVGTAPAIRCGLVTLLSPSRGTLKSTYGMTAISEELLRHRVFGTATTNSDEDALALDVNVGDGEFVGERHDRN